MKYLSSLAIGILAVSNWSWSTEVACLLALVTFWPDLGELTEKVYQSWELLRLERAAAKSLHFEARPEIAWRYWHG
ncbi:MAG TPA: hypothetical protein VMW38_25055 [Terriglobia bacterium]|nr:hypothetical protein [Terriglobia bacterium]